MSRHHRASHHTRDAPRVRELIAARLPLPCVECSRPVTAQQSWHVAHIIPASQGGKTTPSNCGPAHARCNLRAGGKLGAAVTNHRRQAERGLRSWL